MLVVGVWRKIIKQNKTEEAERIRRRAEGQS